MRKLPIYLLIDTSKLMAGKTIELIRKWAETFVVTLRQDPYALETAYISIITYGGSAKQITPLSTLSKFQLPALETNGSSVFAEAFELLMNRVNTEVTKTTPDYLGDWLPLVVIMTNNTPYCNFGNDFKNRNLGGVLAVIGSNVDKKKIKGITENIVSLDSFDSVTVLSFFKWVSSSIGCADICNDLIEFPPPPEDVYIDLSEDNSWQDDTSNYSGAALTDSNGESYSPEISFSEPKELVFNPNTDEFECRSSLHNQDDGSIIVTEMSREGFCGSCNDIPNLFQSIKDSINFLPQIVESSSKGENGKTSSFQKSPSGQAFGDIEDSIVECLADGSHSVYSSVFAPTEVAPMQHMMIQVYLHLPEEIDMVKEFGNEADKNAERRGYEPLEVKLKKNDSVEIELNINGDTLHYNRRKTVTWQGSFVKRAFDFVIPSDITVSELCCSVNIFVNSAIAGEMMFLTSIVDSPRKLNTNILARPTKKLFISYSHKDIKSAEKIAKIHEALGIDVFFDKHRLKAGYIYSEEISQFIQTADTFVLCWSENAAKSEYVEKERQEALALAYPQRQPREHASLRIHPYNIEPHANPPADMIEHYHFEEL